MIPHEYLQLTVAQVLALHAPRRRPGAVALRTIFTALRRLDKQLRDNEAVAKAEQLEWLAQQFDDAPPTT